MANTTNNVSLSVNSSAHLNTDASKKMGSNISPKALASVYRAKVIDAYRNRHIFTVFGNYDSIRQSLLKRGWLEKLPPGRFIKLQGLPEETLLSHAKPGNNYEAVIISKMINHFPAFFVWQPKTQRDLYLDVHPYRNRIRRSHNMDFSTKVGLIGCAEQQHWFRQDGVSGMCYPRFYQLGSNQEERQAFIDDYRVTQCCSLLRFLMRCLDKHEEINDCENGTISPSIVHFALSRVKRQLEDWDNFGLLDVEQSQVPEEEWSNFLENCVNVINNRQKIKCTFRELIELNKTARYLITKMQEKYPELKWDGCKNLWILKPGYENRGQGIVLRHNLNDILQWGLTHSNRRYIAQKYIEQPLLIYQTKFDIRQYLLIIIREATVQIWLYKDCYLKFSSQEFSVEDLRESIHLTNNSVQRKYKCKPDRDVRLPQNNMWCLEQFKSYLRIQYGSSEVWENHVFTGFRANLIAVVMSSLDETSLDENSFELYGCDFMLDEDFNPIIIEINATPDLSSSTDVTGRICPMVMKDLVKVVVDLPCNSRAPTGLFEMVYEVNYKFKHTLTNNEGLNVDGKPVEFCKRHFPERPKFIKKSKIDRKQQFKKLSTKKPLLTAPKKPENRESNRDKVLEASAKEALALRYTMPK